MKVLTKDGLLLTLRSSHDSVLLYGSVVTNSVREWTVALVTHYFVVLQSVSHCCNDSVGKRYTNIGTSTAFALKIFDASNAKHI